MNISSEQSQGKPVTISQYVHNMCFFFKNFFDIKQNPGQGEPTMLT